MSALIASIFGAGFIELAGRFAKSQSGKQFFETPTGKILATSLRIDTTQESTGDIFKELSVASNQMDEIVRKIQKTTAAREEAVSRLEAELSTLSKQESELNERIRNLKDIPLPVADYFANIVNKEEKKSAMRDYALFISGVVVTTLLAIILKKFGWA